MSDYQKTRDCISDLLNHIAADSGYSVNVTVTAKTLDSYGVVSSTSASTVTLKAVVNYVNESSQIVQGGLLKPGDVSLVCKADAGVNPGDVVTIDEIEYEIISISTDPLKAASTLICRKKL